MRILVTGIGGPAGAALGRQLRSLGHWVGGTDLRALDAPAADAFQRVLRADDPGYPEQLAELAGRWGADAVVPSVSEELVPLARVAAAFPVPLLLGDEAAVRIADDKYATAERLRAHGVSVPGFLLPSQAGSAAEAVERLGGSVVMKPRISRGGRGVRVIDAEHAARADAVEAWRTATDALVVQRFAPGPEFAPVVYSPVTSLGSSRCVVLRKLALREGLTGNAVGVTRVAPEGAEVGDLAVAATHALGLSGPVDVDVRLLADGTPAVLEVNARFGANSASAPELLREALVELAHLAGAR